MKRFKYFDLEKKINIKHLRKSSGIKTLKLCLDLVNTGLKILRSSLIAENPHISQRALHKKIQKVLWSA